MFKKILVSLILFFFFSISRSQNKIYKYYLDQDLLSTKKEKAVVIGKGEKEGDIFKLSCYTLTGKDPYIVLHFTDSTLSDINGPFTSYYNDRTVERHGNYLNGFKEGLWERWDSIGRKVDSVFYERGNKMLTATFKYHQNHRLSSYNFKDSIKNTYQDIYYEENGKENFKSFFVGNKGIVEVYDSSGKVTADSVFTRELIEPEFPGGSKGWLNYLRGNLDANTPVNNNANEGTYTVIVKFVIEADGKISNAFAETDLGFGMENEALRIIKKGPNWIPAVRYGQKARSYRRQPLTFVVQGK